MTAELAVSPAAAPAKTLRWGATWSVIAMFGFAVILLAREARVVTDAQFWAEDGWAFYPDAYNLGWRSLGVPLAGYLQSTSRLAALLAQSVPLAWAPTLFACVALAAQVLPAAFLVSARMDQAWPCRWARVLFALIYLALPNDREVYVNLTNAQWHLALLAFLVVVSAPPRRTPARVFDAAALALSGLSGPFALLLAPVALWQHVETRSRETLSRAVIVLAAAAVQGALLLATVHERVTGPLGATLQRLARIVGLQIFLAPLADPARLQALSVWPPWGRGPAALALCLAGIALMGWATWRGPSLLRKLTAFAVLLVAAALARPQVSPHGVQWDELTRPGVGGRYWELPTLAWLGVLFVLASSARGPARLVGLALLAMAALAVSRGWSLPPEPPTDFARLADAFAAAPAGTQMAFPIRPADAGLPMVLVKRH